MNQKVKYEEKNFLNIMANYNFEKNDAMILKNIQHHAIEYEDELLSTFYNFIFSFNHAKSFLHSKDILKRHEKGIRKWYQNLFCGKYDKNYFFKLNVISEVHVNIGLPPHYVNAAFSCIRGFLKEKLLQHQLHHAMSAVDKILDINLDILTISYRHEEQSKLIDEIIYLKNIVEHENIEPFIQPIYNAQTNKIAKYEALMRLIDPQNNSITSIVSYLELSKKINLYEKMMSIMIKKSMEYFKNHNIEFSLNLSYEDIANDEFRAFIYESIKNFPHKHNIIFEILETDFIEDFSVVEAFVKNIRTLGCKIAIDDFGSGFSSMENILKLNPDIIKIDGSLIKNIDTSNESRTIVKNIINMAKELNAKTVAEYVHNQNVYTVVKELGADFIQGYYLSEPHAVKK